MMIIREIAEQADVSMTTVYNVLHGNVKKVSKENTKKIQKHWMNTIMFPN